MPTQTHAPAAAGQAGTGVDIERVISRTADGRAACAERGRIVWSPIRSVWTLSMAGIGLIGGALTISPEAVLVFLLTTAITIGLGHSLGMHRLLIHRSYVTSRPLEYLLVWLGVLVGMAGPIGMIKIHDMRDWAQRQRACHDFYAHRAGFWRDAWRQMNCAIRLERPPTVVIEEAVARDRVYRFMERTWMLQQLPVALVLFALGGWAFVIWGVAVRVTVSLFGHWMVGYYAHREGHQGWRVDGAAVQGFNIPLAALITFGESWHANHHAFPGSARLGVEAGQCDPGWRVLQIMAAAGLARDLVTPADLPRRDSLRRVDPVLGAPPPDPAPLTPSRTRPA